jgi:hypothetical protein
LADEQRSGRLGKAALTYDLDETAQLFEFHDGQSQVA